MEYSKMKYQPGFTITELLMTILLIGILTTIAIPSFKEALVNFRLTSQSNTMVSTLMLARSESIKRKSSVTIRKTGTTWADGWIMFAENPTTVNGTQDSGEVTISKAGSLEGNHTLLSTTSFTNYISYRPDGRTNTNGSFQFCPPKAQHGSFQKLTIAATGRITATDSSTSSTLTCPTSQ